MPASQKINIPSPSLKLAMSAMKKLSDEEKKIIRMHFFSNEIIAEAKAFEARLRKKKKIFKKTDEEIVAITKSIRRKRYDSDKKMLH